MGTSKPPTGPQRDLLQAVADDKVTGTYHASVEVWVGRVEDGYWSYFRSDSRRAISSRVCTLLRDELVSRAEYARPIELASGTVVSRECRVVLTESGEAALVGGAA